MQEVLGEILPRREVALSRVCRHALDRRERGGMVKSRWKRVRRLVERLLVDEQHREDQFV